MKRASVVSLLFSIAATTLAADLSAIRSSAGERSRRRARRCRPACARGPHRPADRRACRRGPRCPSRGGSRNAAAPACAAPGRRGRRCSARSLRRARRTIAEPHSGHFVGITNGFASRGRFSGTTRTTSGITSPARRTITVSPMCTSLRRTSSSLCSVALVTVTPPTNTGASRATGVIAPVRPTWTSMPSTSVAISSAGNLCATAQRGSRVTKPSVRCSVEAVDLVDDAVDVERQAAAPLGDALVERDELGGAARDAALAIDRQPERLERSRAAPRAWRAARTLASRRGRTRRSAAAAAPSSPDRAGAPRRRRCCAD